MSTEMMKDENQANENWPDKEFLETALQQWLRHPKIKVTEFTSKIATNNGDNYTSQMYRVTIKCDHRKEPLNIIVKRLISGEIVTESTALSREVQVLKTILPEMHTLLKKIVPDVEPFGAGYIYSAPAVVVMEDLQPGGFRMAPRHLGLDFNHCSLVLRTLARYHAASVYLMERKSIDFSVFRQSIFGELNNPVLNNYCTGLIRALSAAVQKFDGLEKYAPKLSALADDNYFGRMVQAIDDHEDDDFLVLSHGDVWVNNLLFRYSPSGEPDGVRFVDFQLTSITSPCIDLQYFLHSSSNEVVRTTCVEQLMKEYHETLCKTMSRLNCSTRPPTIEALWKDYYRRYHYGMFGSLSVCAVVLSEPGQFDFNDAVKTGKFQEAMFSSKSFRKALEWFLPLYESKGLL